MKLNVKRIKQPQWSAPMLATLSKNVFFDPDWIFERKLDGVRCLLHKQGDKITLWSRNKILQNKVFPELIPALLKFSSDFILDAEVVSFEGKKTSFHKLSNRLHVLEPDPKLLKQVSIVAYVFDILYLNGHDLTKLPLLWRKKVLEDNFAFKLPLQYLPHKEADGEKYYVYAAQHGWEGIIGKRSDSIYVHQRSKSWLKFKCEQTQEFVIGGFTMPQGSRIKFGALLLGYYEKGKLKYAGRVGTGFDNQTLKTLYQQMAPLLVENSKFIDFADHKNTFWVKPKLVAQIQFTEWTPDGRLRHPSFLGLRTDKIAKQIKREGAWK